MDIKNQVLYRVYWVLLLVAVVAGAILFRTAQISLQEGDRWRAKGDSLYVKTFEVKAERGNIISENGALLASALPVFEVRFDPNSTGMRESDFYDNIDELSFDLANYVDNRKTAGEWKDYLVNHRMLGTRNILLKRKATAYETKEIQKFPLFNKGKYKGGLIIERKDERRRPFGMLANRTIGYIRDNAQPVGLEGFYNEVLAGKAGQRVMQRIGGTHIPINDLAEIEPVAGADIRSTININIQDIAQDALVQGLKKHDADFGCAIVMEVKTGEIKAISNIKNSNGKFSEAYNYAVGQAVEPGSTFKLASIMSLLEDKKVKITDKVNIENGKYDFFGEEMLDATPLCNELDTITVQRAFELSSNVGIAKLVQLHYGVNKKADQFIKRLRSFGLGDKTGISIKGEANPYIKEAYSEKDNWSGISLPWMSTGYESMLTPLQLLTFYNGVANDGRVMKPQLISSIEKYGKVIHQFKPEVLIDQMASRKTIQTAQHLLLSVVENGTARKLKSNRFQFAGKTGTAQTNYSLIERSNQVKYRASFAGYFPADRPKYSVVVMVENPKQNGIYGGQVAGPIFKNIAEDIFELEMDLHEALNQHGVPQRVSTTMPGRQYGYQSDFTSLMDALNVPTESIKDQDWVTIRQESDTLRVFPKVYGRELVPDVVGMGLRDAVHLLEERGLKVTFNGVGKVIRQSIRSGTRCTKQSIKLTLK